MLRIVVYSYIKDYLKHNDYSNSQKRKNIRAIDDL